LAGKAFVPLKILSETPSLKNSGSGRFATLPKPDKDSGTPLNT